ncbi:hypothetical protein pW2_149 [Bacillus phage pW2]|uniref:Uncharacterized protein n=1 Tax=Bacillus phage pW2 TaxID=2500559 RepID=A0A3T0IHY6_9CAUD|nr:hypothetical protein PQE69_gp142 [Bacillus phage pW2]AZU98976.1 hypothetical protein pW2_149 [Bacillus phage pW2]
MEIKAYALVKNDEMIGKFFDTKRSVEETYAKKLEDSQYSIGVFTFAGETEVVEESEYIELHTNKGGYIQWKRGWSFSADDVKDKWNEQYSEGDYIFKIKKEHVRKHTFWGGYVIDNTEHVDIMTPYKKPKPVEEVTEDLEVEKETPETLAIPPIERLIDVIPTLTPLREISRARNESEGIIMPVARTSYKPRRNNYRAMWMSDLGLRPDGGEIKTTNKEKEEIYEVDEDYSILK